ncbi:class I SAM-dependent methyltransferase [Candidatus Gottesmanbacteria bacterium]|nr:class I SAM-dependent methyltransferase [Candidatus Gottesmanbacteria bacterium]
MMKFVADYFIKIGNELGYMRHKAMLSLLPKKANATYLDLGCGDGVFTREMARAIGTTRISGIDIIDSEIAKAQKNGIAVKKADLDGVFPFSTNTFDVVTGTQVIEHLFEVDSFVSEVYRVLKPGGIAVISTENLSSWHNIVALLVGLQPSTGPYISNRFSIGFHPLAVEHRKEHKTKPYLAEMRGHTRVMAFRSFVALFERYGFRVEEAPGIGFYPFPSILAAVFARIDPWHAVDVIVKLRKL